MARKEKETISEEVMVPISVKFDLLWPRLREVIAFSAGLGIMMFEALADTSDRPWLYAAAIGMMGLPIARAVEGTLGKFGSNQMGPTEEPPNPAPPPPREPRAK